MYPYISYHHVAAIDITPPRTYVEGRDDAAATIIITTTDGTTHRIELYADHKTNLIAAQPQKAKHA